MKKSETTHNASVNRLESSLGAERKEGTLSHYGAESTSVQLEAVYPRPIERVWRALTSNEQLGRWLMPTDFEPVLGREFRFRRTNRSDIRGAVLVVDRPYRLEYSWESDDTPLSVVTWTLTAVDESQTAVRLEHRKIGLRAQFGLGTGWSNAIYRRLPAFLHLPHRGVKLIRTAAGASAQIATGITRRQVEPNFLISDSLR
jgi:uncharacterized protein YndB with AHSA1/START domain